MCKNVISDLFGDGVKKLGAISEPVNTGEAKAVIKDTNKDTDLIVPNGKKKRDSDNVLPGLGL